jgi:hypothetical protein
MSSTTLAWAGLLTTIVGGILSVYFYIRSRRVKRLSSTFVSGTLQKRSHPEIQITFRGHEIENLSRMLVFVWNSGTTEIRSADVPGQEWPLLVLAEGTRVLSVATLAVSTDHINIEAFQSGERAVRFRFGYLNPGDGAVAEVLFEAKTPFLSPEHFSAPIIGGSSPRFGESSFLLGKETLLSLLETAGAVLCGGGLHTLFVHRVDGTPFQYAAAALAVIVGASTTLAANYVDRRRPHRQLPPFAWAYLKRIVA